MGGTVVAVGVSPGDAVGPRTAVVTLEAMKMEHVVRAEVVGTVAAVAVAPGDTVTPGQPLATVVEGAATAASDTAEAEPSGERTDLARLHERLALTRDEARPDAVAKRHATGHLTAREQIAALLDAGSLVEYGSLPVAAQRSRRSLDDLIATTPADGIVTGIGTVEGLEVAVLAYDYTVLAGTQGYFNHHKTDRILQIAAERSLPVVLFGEGGGGRPGDTDTSLIAVAGLNLGTFAAMARLSGRVPTIGVLTGRAFAGNAALLGCCDLIVATRDANLGMAGPAMIEGGGLGRFSPEQIGPMDVQSANGVVDLVVDDDLSAIDAARQALAALTRRVDPDWEAGDQTALREVVSLHRKQIFDVHRLVDLLADEGSVLEVRSAFGRGAVTAFVRIEGRPYGLIANDSAFLGGAIDADAADKFARFLRLCDAHGLPIVSLCDTPGFMVGPDAEQTATVRHYGRMFVAAAHLTVPMLAVVVRKGYGLGAMAMAGGGFAETTATIAWPTGEIGAMGLEGAVRLGYGRELAAIADEAERRARYDALVAAQYEAGSAINAAMLHEIDEVIDPADTRRWITATLGSWSDPGSHRPVDPW